ncbi:hypothetical protein NV63_06425 [Elizabethkingia anophelis]|nr:hypothetical protein NV63_06425 [Elizabethkingia anophelis]
MQRNILTKENQIFYVLKFNHSAQNETTVDVINYNTLESFKLKFKNNVVETESLHSDGMNRPRMIFLKQLRKQKLYLNDEGFKYVDTFPSDSITCK